MSKYLFKTTATMKEYNNKKWWIDSGIISEITLDAETLENALELYREKVLDKFYIDISKTALKNKSPMYHDNADGEPVQCGYVITAKTEFQDEMRYKWTAQYIDLWVTIFIVSNPFEEVKQCI